MQDFFEYLNKSIDINDEAKSFISSVIKIREFKKGDILITQGQSKVLDTYFVLSGCLRSYMIDDDGKEHTLQFAIKDWWISDYIAYYGKGESSLSVDCLTDCIVVQSDRLNIEKVFEKFPQIETFHRKNLENSFVRLNKRIVNQLQLNARDRYFNFIADFPKMESVAKNYHIASYLGITQQSLSRIRSQK
ncbi:MAG: Crp/Fnr family transcriptional regulator [Flavobacteriales bacterium]|jgi:CRP-like cAMP-binding protein|nr:Crp/Fnr family transcriptional regulator [Flavobacteriales bacterium]